MAIKVSFWGFALVIYLSMIDFCYSLLQKEPPQINYINEIVYKIPFGTVFDSSLSAIFSAASFFISSLPFFNYSVKKLMNIKYLFDTLVTDISRTGYLLKVEFVDIASEIKAACPVTTSRPLEYFDGNIFADEHVYVVFSPTVDDYIPSCSSLFPPAISQEYPLASAIKDIIEPFFPPSGDVASLVSADCSSAADDDDDDVFSCSPLFPLASCQDYLLDVVDTKKAGSESFFPLPNPTNTSALVLSSVSPCSISPATELYHSYLVTTAPIATIIIRKRCAQEDLYSASPVRRCFGLSKDEPTTVFMQDTFVLDNDLSFIDIVEEVNTPVDNIYGESICLDSELSFLVGYADLNEIFASCITASNDDHVEQNVVDAFEQQYLSIRDMSSEELLENFNADIDKNSINYMSSEHVFGEYEGLGEEYNVDDATFDQILSELFSNEI